MRRRTGRAVGPKSPDYVRVHAGAALIRCRRACVCVCVCVCVQVKNLQDGTRYFCQRSQPKWSAHRFYSYYYCIILYYIIFVSDPTFAGVRPTGVIVVVAVAAAVVTCSV